MDKESSSESWESLASGLEQCGEAVSDLIDENQEFCYGVLTATIAIAGLWITKKIILEK